VSFDEGLQVLTDTIRSQLGPAVQLNSAISAISQRPDGWLVSTRADGREETQEHAAVIYTAPAYRLPAIQLTTAQPIQLAPFAQINYPPVASVVLGFKRSDVAHPLDGFGMLIPEVEKFNTLGALFSSSLFPNRAPEGHVTITSYIGGTRAPELALRSPEQMIELTLQDLRVLLGVTGRPTFEHTFAFPKAIPQYEVGYGRFKDLMTSIETKAPGLFLAGNFRDGISLADSIVSGCKVAERVEQFVRQGVPNEICQAA
jgi:oxygen-dependent protoporphyrinogen oxidase